MLKNVASQKVVLLAIDTANNVPKTGDAGNITAYVSKDDGTVTVLGDTSATEIDATNAPGLYSFDLTQAETNADKLIFSGKSSTSGIRIVPKEYQTVPQYHSSQAIDSSGRVDVSKIAGTTQTARDIGASVLISSGTGTGQLSVSSGVIAANVTQVKGTTSAGQAGYVGIDWATVANQDTIVSLSATTVSTVTTASNMISQANVRTAVGLASANLDTQLGAIAGYIDTEVASIYSRIGVPAGASIAADIAALPTAASTATAVWDKDISSAYLPGRAGYYVQAILAAIGGFTGTGVNTILGFLKAIMSKTASTPSDVGGTFSAATDSIEALADASSSSAPTTTEIWSYGQRTLTSTSSNTVVSPVTETGEVNITQGDDYLFEDGLQIPFSNTGWPDITGASVLLKLNIGGTVSSFSGVVISSSSCYVEFTNAQTEAMAAGQHTYDLQITLSNGHIFTPFRKCPFNVEEDI